MRMMRKLKRRIRRNKQTVKIYTILAGVLLGSVFVGVIYRGIMSKQLVPLSTRPVQTYDLFGTGILPDNPIFSFDSHYFISSTTIKKAPSRIRYQDYELPREMEAKAEPSEKTVEESLVEFAESIDSTQTSPTAENNLPESSSKRVIY